MSIIGTTINWGDDQPVEIPASERRRHVYVIGQTGTGKSTLLRNLILQDIDEGRGVGFIDPHGDVAEELLDCIPAASNGSCRLLQPGRSGISAGLESAMRPMTGAGT